MLVHLQALLGQLPRSARPTIVIASRYQVVLPPKLVRMTSRERTVSGAIGTLALCAHLSAIPRIPAPLHLRPVQCGAGSDVVGRRIVEAVTGEVDSREAKKPYKHIDGTQVRSAALGAIVSLTSSIVTTSVVAASACGIGAEGIGVEEGGMLFDRSLRPGGASVVAAAVLCPPDESARDALSPLSSCPSCDACKGSFRRPEDATSLCAAVSAVVVRINGTVSTAGAAIAQSRRQRRPRLSREARGQPGRVASLRGCERPRQDSTGRDDCSTRDVA